MNFKKLSLYTSALVIGLSLTGCGSKPVVTQQSGTQLRAINTLAVITENVVAKDDQTQTDETPSINLIKVSDATITPNEYYNTKKAKMIKLPRATDVIGTVTNNNSSTCNFNISVFYFNDEGKKIAVKNIKIEQLRSGDIRYFDDMAVTNDLREANYKISINQMQ